MARTNESSPYVEFDRKQWRTLRKSTPLVLTEDELYGLRGLGEQIDLEEVAEVYLPLARLIHLQVAARQRLFAATATFLGEKHPDRQVPFVIGVAGSVAVGKSTTARVLQALLARWDHHPRVDLVTTDGFLYPTRELQRRGIMHRKGFPESYDRRKLLRFVTEVKSGAEEVAAPVYSHTSYDIIPGQYHLIRQPDILIIEGLNVLQTGPRLMVSDLFDFSIYVAPASRTSKPGTSSGSSRYATRRSPIRTPTFTTTPASPTVTRPSRRRRSGTRSTTRTWWRTFSPPVPAQPWCCARTPITRSTGCDCASSETAQAPNRRWRAA